MAKFELKLPKMGESVAEATITSWLKAVGDTIEADEAILEIATDKIDSEVSSEVRGTLVEKLFDNDDIVHVGQIIAVIETEEMATATEIAPKFITPETEKVAVAAATEMIPSIDIVPETEKVAVAAATEITPSIDIVPETEKVTVATVTEMTPSTDIVPETEKVALETIPVMDVVREIEKNEKITEAIKVHEDFLELERFYSPLVKNIAEKEGVSLEELKAINGSGREGRITKNDILEYVSGKEFVVSELEVERIEKPLYKVEVSASVTEESVIDKGMKPAEIPVSEVKEMEKYLHTVEIPESIVKETVTNKEVKPIEVEELKIEKAVCQKNMSLPEVDKTETREKTPEFFEETAKVKMPESQPTGKAAPVSVNGAHEIVEMDRIGKMISHHMTQSVQTSVHVQSFIEVDVTNICKWREKNKSAFEKREGEKLTFTPIFMEAIAKAIKDFPLINISVDGDLIIKKKNINLGMAVALPSGNLIVPVIKNADRLNLIGMAKTVNDLASRARSNQLKPDEIQGGTYTVTNIGTFGSIFGTPVINQPQVAILALGAIRKVPAVIEAPDGDFIGIRHKMFLSHSYDHRVVNGALGGGFLKRVAEYLEDFNISSDIR